MEVLLLHRHAYGTETKKNGNTDLRRVVCVREGMLQVLFCFPCVCVRARCVCVCECVNVCGLRVFPLSRVSGERVSTKDMIY